MSTLIAVVVALGLGLAIGALLNDLTAGLPRRQQLGWRIAATAAVLAAAALVAAAARGAL